MSDLRCDLPNYGLRVDGRFIRISVHAKGRRTYHLQTSSTEEATKWYSALSGFLPSASGARSHLLLSDEATFELFMNQREV